MNYFIIVESDIRLSQEVDGRTGWLWDISDVAGINIKSPSLNIICNVSLREPEVNMKMLIHSRVRIY